LKIPLRRTGVGFEDELVAESFQAADQSAVAPLEVVAAQVGVLGLVREQ
jgi:hypothetical protein